MKIGGIFRFILIVACIIGAIALAATKVNKQERARQSVELQRSQARQEFEKAQKEREREARKQREDEENADNAKYQVKRWNEIYSENMRKRCLTDRMTRAQTAQLKRDIKEAREQLTYWCDRRQHEIVRECGDIDLARENEEYKELSLLRNKLYDDEANE